VDEFLEVGAEGGFSSLRGAVVFAAAAGVSVFPFGFDETFFFHSVENWINGAFTELDEMGSAAV